MDKILTPVDRVLSEIGRIILLKPWLSTLFLLLLMVFTFITGRVAHEVGPRHLTLKVPAFAALAAADLPSEQQPSTFGNSMSDTDTLINTPEQQVAAHSPVSAVAGKKIKAATATPTAAPHVQYAKGRVHRSLVAEAKKLGLPTALANQLPALASITPLGHVHAGDQFSVLYDTAKTTLITPVHSKSRHKKKTKTIAKQVISNNILAVQFTHDGKTFPLIHFTDPKGHADFYTPNGEGTHEAIVRQPLAATHISSCFSNSRFDPVLHFVRPHLGVDYAAPVGTPVKAAGTGVIASLGYRGGYGNAVVIRHGDKYSTLYGHLSRFSGVRLGQTVQQGQVIGYVGQTGFATGPHLHFEIRAYDVPYNPLTVALPGVQLPAAYRAKFLAQTKVLLSQLRGNEIMLAQKKDLSHQG